MRVLIHPQTITADEGLRARATEALEAAFTPVRQNLLWVDAYLTDVNGPPRGPDKRCRVVAHLRTGGPVVVGRTGVDPVAAVAAAATQCRRLVQSRLKRRLVRRRLAA